MEIETKKSASSEKIIAQALVNLAVLKNQERSEKQIAAYSAYLAKHFSAGEVIKACEFFLQRNKFFPDISDFFNLLKPMATLDQMALEACDNLSKDLRQFAIYKDFVEGANQTSIEILDRIGWQKIYDTPKKDLIEIFKQILNKPSNMISQGINNEKNLPMA